ncbi:telomere length regulation protein-domain-containing protein [Massariosphaeria phaeospora]|uniref:Telomere length regulation protein-domain-containing protein n=1 Tax=Massariosphaeria phaeospora TaxID=100035 RepID=A0A7C8MGU2_9PLEO|nr:telomere length regulation protein-domain-containing protein [Massariosphaeria phaeospora]
MEELLTQVSTTKVKRSTTPLIQASASQYTKSQRPIKSAEDALEALKNQPDLDTVHKILSYLAAESELDEGFSLVVPEPLSANIAYNLVNNTIPDFWRTFKPAAKQRKHLIRCLQNPCGLGTIISRLRPLILDCRQKKSVDITRDPSAHIEDLIDVLEHVLSGDRISSQIWNDIKTHAKNDMQKKLVWREYVAQTASGRILSLVAEAEDALKERIPSRRPSWLADGNGFASWLGRNIAFLMNENSGVEESVVAVTEVCGKALMLGYTDRIAESITSTVIRDESTQTFEGFLRKLKAFEQRKYLDAVIAYVAKQYCKSIVGKGEDVPEESSPTISGIATLLRRLVKENELLEDHLVITLTKSTVAALDDSIAARRGVIAAVAQNEDKIQTVLENCLKLFGDSFYVKHTPIMQQEALAQTLAITCGYVQRSQPMFLTMMAKSSYHTAGMSNRIGASSPRARFLGIAIGTAISKMVDKPDLQLKFELEGDEATEAKWYQRLTNIYDKLGKLSDLKVQASKVVARKKKHPQQSKPLANTEIVGPRVVEILNDSDVDEDDDLVPYEKPDSDPDDDTDDATEINRNKPTAPVYIRDLIAGLRDQDHYDRHQLSLATAASLIRRKANFGTEVTDHLDELATILIGLSDNYDLPDFAVQRQQALIAVLLAKPAPMAQWFARAFFSGDYSLTQRVAMLTTLGLGARELAGLKDASTEDLIPSTPSFPSKTLPAHLHELYTPASDPDPVAKITRGLAQQLLSPMAATAADQLTGPNILKVRTFSSRMAVEAKRRKPIPNALAKIVADNFFFPLTGRWWMTLRSNANANSSIYASTHLLPPLLHTLALLLYAAGANTLALPQMTREFWDLLLSVRGLAANDKAVLGALLFALLMLLETNEDQERLATEQAKELLETQQWVKMVFDGLGAGSDEDEKVRVLAAGVLVRAQEVVEKYQRRMVGAMMDY